MEGSAKKKGKKSSSQITTRNDTVEEITNLRIIVEELVTQNKDLKEKVTESLKANEFINEKFEDYRRINEEVLKKLKEIKIQNQDITNQINEIKEKNIRLENQIKVEQEERNKLEERINTILMPLEIEKRSKNLELHGLMEIENENCHEKVKEILSKITPKLVSIINCFRVGQKTFPNGDRKKRAILIKFQSQDHRDIAFASRSNLLKIEEHKLYLNENLPPYLRMLRGKANALRKQKGYKFLWMKNNNLLLRKNEESNVISLKSTLDLDKII